MRNALSVADRQVVDRRSFAEALDGEGVHVSLTAYLMSAPDYGYCPKCGKPGFAREKRPYGNDRCTAGHSCPSASAICLIKLRQNG
jgi:hypothetical protein